MPKSRQLRQQWFDLIRLKAAFGRLARGVDFQQKSALRRSNSAAVSSMVLINSQTIGRMDHRHQRQRAPDFVPLQMPDQVPANRQIGQFLGLLPKLLRPAFAQVGATGLDQRPNFRRAHVFGHCHQFYCFRTVVRCAPRLRQCARAPGQDFRQLEWKDSDISLVSRNTLAAGSNAI